MNKIHAAYPWAEALVSDNDTETARRTLGNATADSLAEWTSQHTITLNLAEQAFKCLLHRPRQGDENSLVVVTGEFGNALSPAVAARAMVIRDMVNPGASLLIQPNSSINETNNNFSAAEKRALQAGSTEPVVDRLRTAVDATGATEITIFGPSQGAVVGGAYAAHRDTPVSNFAALEAPNVKARSNAKLALNFLFSGKALKPNIGLNFDESDSEALHREFIEAIGPAGMIKFSRGIVRSENLALLGIMRRATLLGHINASLFKGAGVVHAWGDKEEVSGDAANSSIRDAVLSEGPRRGRYEDYRLPGADHSITNVYALCGALARRASQIAA